MIAHFISDHRQLMVVIVNL